MVLATCKTGAPGQRYGLLPHRHIMVLTTCLLLERQGHQVNGVVAYLHAEGRRIDQHLHFGPNWKMDGVQERATKRRSAKRR